MTAPLGPVSRALEADLHGEIERHGIVAWLDRDGLYRDLIAHLIEQRAARHLSYDVATFSGSHLETMLALEALAGEAERPRLLVHLPGFTEDSVRTTPLYELYAAGVRYRKALDTLVRDAATGHVPQERIDAFLQSGDRSLATADRWLAEALAAPAGGLAETLRGLPLTALADDLLTGGPVSQRLTEPNALAVLWHHLEATTGLTAAWREQAALGEAPMAEDVAFLWASWALAVEYVHDLAREPYEPALGALKGLPRVLVAACGTLAAHLRERHARFYAGTADDTEVWLGSEVARATAVDLGRIDTFRFEEQRLLEGAVAAVADGRAEAARGLVDGRLEGGSFWLQREPQRQSAWRLLAAAVTLQETLARAGQGLAGATDLAGALARYVEVGADVDRAHRHLEQHRTRYLYPQLPLFERLRDMCDGLRGAWRMWADGWALDLARLYRAGGFRPPATLEQRGLYEQVVQPLVGQGGPTAYVLVDALRYEMATELRDALADQRGVTVELAARFAELPTETAVGMNALAPVAANGRLRTVLGASGILGFRAGEFQVTTPATRQKALHERAGGLTCPWYDIREVLGKDVASLTLGLSKARLVVVTSRTIDEGGEANTGTSVFETGLQEVMAACRLLNEAGVQRFVITADHGFLLLDERSTVVQPHGRRVDPSRRHVLSPSPADHLGELRACLTDLGYDCEQDLHLMMPETTARFDTGQRSGNFAHGGASLQERAVPVLVVRYKTAAGGSSLEYRVEAQAQEDVAGLHALKATVNLAPGDMLPFGGLKEVALTVRVVDERDVALELCQTRRGARLEGGLLRAVVGEEFEVFFRLLGRGDARVQVELVHPSGEVRVTPCRLEARFAVTASGASVVAAAAPAPTAPSREWLVQLPEGGIRALFAHLADHDSADETDVVRLLGGARQARAFAARFEEYAVRAPFEVRIDQVNGVKRYVRTGGRS